MRRRRAGGTTRGCAAAAMMVALLAVGCRRGDDAATQQADGAVLPGGPSSAPRGAPTAAPAPADSGGPPVRPDSTLTPGATLPVTAADICVPGYSKKVRNVPAAVKRGVYAKYGIATHAPGEYEVDHLISLELGGSNSERNLWPESYRTQPWNARVKDRLENELHRRVCDGSLDLATAQRAIAGDWIAAYARYVGAPPDPAGPAPVRRRRRH